MQIWSEVDSARAREIVADIATLIWVFLWGSIGIRLYGFLANLAESGRLVRRSGTDLRGAGDRIGGALEGIPLVGEGAADGVRGAFAAAGDPLIAFGTDLERLLIAIAAIIGLLVVATALVPWLTRYWPWRIERLRRLSAGVRAIRRKRFATDTPVSPVELERILASRALHRLEYDRLLDYTPDPLGDWISGRHDRLARAELEGVGLRPAVAR